VKAQQIREKLEKELKKCSLHLVWFPDERFLGPDQLVVFGAEQALDDTAPPLIAGCGRGGFAGRNGNSSVDVQADYHGRFLEALKAVGIPQSALHSHYPTVGRAKIWPTFMARLTPECFAALELPKK